MARPANLSSIWKLVISVLICEVTGIISGWISSAEMNTWYATLNKPSWNPPGYIFGPVWTSLYLLMGISLWLVWKSNALESRKLYAELLFALQLFLNFWWSVIFFKFHSPGWAMVDISFMLITILITIFSFAPISKLASWLMVPYISWVSFASMLNYTVWILNR